MDTLNKDELYLIFMQMDDLTLLNFCKTGKKGAKMCRDENFWKRRTMEKFGPSQKNNDETWKDYYLKKVFRKGEEYNRDLYDAARLGNKQEVYRLIQLGADIQYGIDGAIYANDQELSKELFKRILF